MSKAAVREYDHSSGSGSSAGKSAPDPVKVKKAAGVIRAINHPLRQAMIRLLEEHHRMTVTDLYNRLNLEQSVASQHLAILRQARVVITSRNGKFIYYSANEKRLSELNALVEQIITL